VTTILASSHYCAVNMMIYLEIQKIWWITLI